MSKTEIVRRGFISAVAATGLGWLLPKSARSKLRRPCPWASRADELFEEEGPWADYAAFKEWLDNGLERHGFEFTISDLDCDSLTEFGQHVSVPLYCLFSDAYDNGPTA